MGQNYEHYYQYMRVVIQRVAQAGVSIQEQVRAAIQKGLLVLVGIEDADFTWRREKTGSTDGNLGAQMLKLEEAGYVAMQKRFVGRKPQTVYRMTPKGRKALAGYVAALKRLLGGAL